LGKAVPECLRGAPAATVFQNLDDFSIGSATPDFLAAVTSLYREEMDALGAAGQSTLDAVRRIENLRRETYSPAHGAAYGQDDFSRGLMQIARLIKARVGLEAASIDLGGWDSHFAQSTIMDPLMARLTAGLAAFYRDLGEEIDRTTVVVMTEFGRRLAENSAFGTDHGRGSVMFVMGGGVLGGRVLGDWPGLTRDVLEGPGDVPVVTNYRNVLAPILQRHGTADSLAEVFPGFHLSPLELYSSAGSSGA
jgi:uncharacterized protein (DUF1501 family)